jgi:hypothetical protein
MLLHILFPPLLPPLPALPLLDLPLPLMAGRFLNAGFMPTDDAFRFNLRNSHLNAMEKF